MSRLSGKSRLSGMSRLSIEEKNRLSKVGIIRSKVGMGRLS